jgi:hypothetical protein
MRYYYFIKGDEPGTGFIATFDKMHSINQEDRGPWAVNDYEIVWEEGARYWINRVMYGGMATKRIFDSNFPSRRRELIDRIFRWDDE